MELSEGLDLATFECLVRVLDSIILIIKVPKGNHRRTGLKESHIEVIKNGGEISGFSLH